MSKELPIIKNAVKIMPHLLTIQEFADLKGMARKSVWYHLKNGSIEGIVVGKTSVFIDSVKYKDITKTKF